MDKQYYKIGEVSKILGVNASTLRFWETEFRQLRLVKLSSNQRYYTPKHIDFLRRLKIMLHEEKYTIEGAKQKLLADTVVSEEPAIQPVNNNKRELNIDAIKTELLELRNLLKIGI